MPVHDYFAYEGLCRKPSLKRGGWKGQFVVVLPLFIIFRPDVRLWCAPKAVVMSSCEASLCVFRNEKEWGCRWKSIYFSCFSILSLFLSLWYQGTSHVKLHFLAVVDTLPCPRNSRQQNFLPREMLPVAVLCSLVTAVSSLMQRTTTKLRWCAVRRVCLVGVCYGNVFLYSCGSL